MLSENEMQFLHEELFPRREKLITLLTKVVGNLYNLDSYLYVIRFSSSYSGMFATFMSFSFIFL